MLTVLSSLVAALAWPATLLAATNFIDSKWTIALDRYYLSMDWYLSRKCKSQGETVLDVFCVQVVSEEAFTVYPTV